MVLVVGKEGAGGLIQINGSYGMADWTGSKVISPAW